MRGLRFIALILAVVAISAAAAGQMRNPPPASISSMGGTHLGPPPASIYSMPTQNFNSFGFGFGCCAPFPQTFVRFGAHHGNFPHNFPRDGFRGHHRFNQGVVYPGYIPYYGYSYPYYYPYSGVEMGYADEALPGGGTFDREQYRPQEYESEQEAPGPTVFDRRTRTQYPPTARDEAPYRDREVEERAAGAAATPPPVAPETKPEEPVTTVLVFRDGHRSEIHNYAIMGKTLYLFSGERRKVPLADLDLQATVRVNDDRGVEFHVPTGD